VERGAIRAKRRTPSVEHGVIRDRRDRKVRGPAFSGWCGVRDSSAVTLITKVTREGKQGSIAKRWSRRTRRNVEGRIEFRGVG